MNMLTGNPNTNLLRFAVRNPRSNLPETSSRKRGESNFLLAFQRAYAEGNSGIGGREFALSGYGIADFIWVSFSSPFSNVKSTAFSLQKLKERLLSYKLTAFELKLHDWRKALKQAYRYSYFSDIAVVVMPCDNILPAKKSLEKFKQLRIGLWGFDLKSGKIKEFYTPCGMQARNLRAREKAVEIMLTKCNLRKFRERFNSLG